MQVIGLIGNRSEITDISNIVLLLCVMAGRAGVFEMWTKNAGTGEKRSITKSKLFIWAEKHEYKIRQK